jgi:molybdate transport system regulatory protein
METAMLEVADQDLAWLSSNIDATFTPFSKKDDS